MKGPVRVEFMPIKDGDRIDLMSSYYDHTIVHEVGFKPGPARSRSGWLVLLVHEGEAPYRAYNGSEQILKIPKAIRPHKVRGPRS